MPNTNVDELFISTNSDYEFAYHRNSRCVSHSPSSPSSSSSASMFFQSHKKKIHSNSNKTKKKQLICFFSSFDCGCGLLSISSGNVCNNTVTETMEWCAEINANQSLQNESTKRISTMKCIETIDFRMNHPPAVTMSFFLCYCVHIGWPDYELRPCELLCSIA